MNTESWESKRGWRGANTPAIMNAPIKCDKCGVKKRDSSLRIFHRRADKNPSHIVVCKKCAKKLPMEWHGCGCGG